MRKLSTEKRAMILNALVEGNSINATARLFGASKVGSLALARSARTPHHSPLGCGSVPAQQR